MASSVKIDNEEVEKILNDEENSLSKKEQLHQGFAKVDENYSSELNESKNPYENSQITLERKEYTPLSNEELEEIAINSLSDYYSSSKQSLEQDNEKQISLLNSKSQKLVEDASENKASLDKQIDQAKEKAKSEAINRGLARSSIIMKQIEGYDDKKINQTSQIEQNLKSSLADVNQQIESLNASLETSLKNLDIAYAVKLQAKLNELKEEQQERLDEVLEYNNTQALKEAEFNAKQKENYAKYMQSSANQNSANENKTGAFDENQISMEKEKYNIAQNYFASLEKQEALNELLGEDRDYYKANLGSFFYKLFQEIRDR